MSRPPALPLPHLLSLLPKSGREALVRPTTWPESSFYQITRTKLKFRPTPSVSATRSSSAGDTPSTDGSVAALKASGKAWGMAFWDGKYVPPASSLSLPDPRIRGGAKKRWVAVDASTLPESVQEVLRSSSERLRKGREEREQTIRQRREARLAGSAAVTDTGLA